MFPGRRYRSGRERLRYQTPSKTAPAVSQATASSAATLALPTIREVSTSGTGSTPSKASLMVSLAINGRPSSGAIARARVVFPLAGGPDTTTNVPGGRSWPRHHHVNPRMVRVGFAVVEVTSFLEGMTI
jgi:hypothetical protein